MRLSAKHRLKSGKSLISYHPGHTGNKESNAKFGPVQMRFGGERSGGEPKPTKECQHQGYQAHRKSRVAIDENGDRRESKRDGCEYHPKPLTWRNPGWNQVRGHTQIEDLTQRRNSADSREGATFGETLAPGRIRLSYGV